MLESRLILINFFSFKKMDDFYQPLSVQAARKNMNNSRMNDARRIYNNSMRYVIDLNQEKELKQTEAEDKKKLEEKIRKEIQEDFEKQIRREMEVQIDQANALHRQKLLEIENEKKLLLNLVNLKDDTAKKNSEQDKEEKKVKEENSCVVCMDNDISIICVPCGHLCLCGKCAENLSTCPMCKTVVTKMQKIYKVF